MIKSSSSPRKNFTSALGQWSSLSNSEQRTTLNELIEQVLKIFSDRGLNTPDSGFLDFAVRASLHNFQILVAAGTEEGTPENQGRFCTDFVLQLVESAPSSN